MTTKQPDWEAIERAYRAGLLSIREIASAQCITHGAINKRAKRDGWERDLKAKIKAKADALVSKRTVSTKTADTGDLVVGGITYQGVGNFGQVSQSQENTGA